MNKIDKCAPPRGYVRRGGAHLLCRDHSIDLQEHAPDSAFSGAFSLFNTFANVRSSEYQNAKIAQKPAVIGHEAVLPLSASSVRIASAEEYIKFFLSLAKTIAAEYNIFGICMPIPGVSGYS